MIKRNEGIKNYIHNTVRITVALLTGYCRLKRHFALLSIIATNKTLWPKKAPLHY